MTRRCPMILVLSCVALTLGGCTSTSFDRDHDDLATRVIGGAALGAAIGAAASYAADGDIATGAGIGAGAGMVIGISI